MKKSGLKGMHHGGGTKHRGRTSLSERQLAPDTAPYVSIAARTEATRPVTAGTGRHRGDRRDTSRLYTGKQKHASRGSNPRPDVKTRKR